MSTFYLNWPIGPCNVKIDQFGHCDFKDCSNSRRLRLFRLYLTLYMMKIDDFTRDITSTFYFGI